MAVLPSSVLFSKQDHCPSLFFCLSHVSKMVLQYEVQRMVIVIHVFNGSGVILCGLDNVVTCFDNICVDV